MKFTVEKMGIGWLAGFIVAFLSPANAQFLEPDVEVIYHIDGEAIGDQFGFVLDPIGDLNGDDAPEILTGAVYHDAGGFNAGKVYVISGVDGSILRTHVGTTVWGMLGWRVASAGDFNNDGIEDYTVGAAGEQGSTTDGEVFVFSGDLNLTAEESLLWSQASFTPGDRFGHATGTIGDLDGDGHDDLLVGSPKHDAAGNDAGRAYIFSGRDQSILRIHDGDQPNGRFGNAARAIGDVDGDSVIDYVITSPGGGPVGKGKAAVFSGVDGTKLYEMFPTSPTGVDYGRYFANSPGDMTGDGVPDLFISDFWDVGAGPRTGIAYLYDGTDGSALPYEIAGDSAQDWTGFGGRTVGDLNGDGLADFITNFTGNPEVTEAPFAGRVVLFSGADGTPFRTITSLYGNPAGTQGEWFGYDCTGIDDVNGDDIPDLVVTAGYNYENGPQSGRLYVIAGRDDRPTSTVPGGGDRGALQFDPIVPNPTTIGASGLPGGLIRFSSRTSGDAMLSLFDASGRQISQRQIRVTLGTNELGWRDATEPNLSLEPGVYFLSVFDGSVAATQKVVLIAR